ncbi:MAG: hypothetical protein QHH18_05385 [Candidatus Bathyarchaeota archaeon]|nr:hypothetical protein [Candidatus Bathyarchaeota archaeon A05DMB-5]MDH7558021.1 hypothetical protein [Candidatus Bathyarchaeota archaeon]
MIQQHTITTTQKYNFPHPTTDTMLPQRLIQLSLHTLKTVQNNTIQLNQQTIQQPNMETHTIQLSPKPITLKPNRTPTTIAAVDTSNIKIGETPTGIIAAVRGAALWKQNKHYHYTRLGPFIFHITEENKRQLYQTLANAYLDTNNTIHAYPLNLTQMPNRIANLLEKWLQTTLTKTLTNSLILLDGSLTAGTPDTPTPLMKETLINARKRNNTVLAFSKMTNLRANGYLITDALPPHTPPYILETYGFKPKPPTVLLGEVYVAKLTNGNYAFRLDIDKEIPHEQKIESVQKLLGNDHLQQSYPETLRLAHILCTFTANEVIAMQHFTTRHYNLKIVNRPDMHRLLFGPYGKGDLNA